MLNIGTHIIWRQKIYIIAFWVAYFAMSLYFTVLFHGNASLVTVFAAMIAIAWIILSKNHPLTSFLILLIIFCMLYTRLSFNSAGAEGGTNRGAIAVGDILWGCYIIGRLLHGPPKRETMTLPVVYRHILAFFSPYLFLAFLLPILGCVVDRWPLSFSIPGFRQIEWISFAFISFDLTRQYGKKIVQRYILNTLLLLSVLHFAYALIQFGYSIGILTRSWIILDDLFSLQHQHSWFYYPRVTGLLVNPNSYGIYSAFMLCINMAITLIKIDINKILLTISSISSLLALILSGSRSGMIGACAVLLLFILCFISNPKILMRYIRIVLSVIVLLAALISLSQSFIPETLQGRFMRFTQVFTQGASADRNAEARVTMWDELLHENLDNHPLGTWVPPSYAMNSPIDSYYVFTTLQGTPLFTFTWFSIMGASIIVGYRAAKHSLCPYSKAIGVAFAGLASILIASSISVSPMLDSALIVIFWTFFGLLLASIKGISVLPNTFIPSAQNKA